MSACFFTEEEVDGVEEEGFLSDEVLEEGNLFQGFFSWEELDSGFGELGYLVASRLRSSSRRQ